MSKYEWILPPEQGPIICPKCGKEVKREKPRPFNPNEITGGTYEKYGVCKNKHFYQWYSLLRRGGVGTVIIQRFKK